MLKSICVICLLVAGALPLATLIRLCKNKISAALGYISAMLVHTMIFTLCVWHMSDLMVGASMFPVKIMAGVVGAESCICVALIVYLSWRKDIKLQLPYVCSSKQDILLLLLSIVVFLITGMHYFSQVSKETITMMADINRVDLFGVINNNPITMMAYYIKSLGGISQANAVCVVVPLFFYVAVVCALWEVAAALFAEDASKRNLCFLAEAILVLFGNCMFSMTGIITSGLVQMTNILLAIALPTVFSLCVRIYRVDKKDTIAYWVVGILMLVCLYILDAVAFVLTAMTVFIFVLLIIGRRYLPWLRSSN